MTIEVDDCDELLMHVNTELVAEEDLMKHMASLRTQYCRCMKSGSAIATTHRQRWLVRKLSFLKPYIKKRLRATSDFDAAVLKRANISIIGLTLIFLFSNLIARLCRIVRRDVQCFTGARCVR